jgi:hypothetical protein
MFRFLENHHKGGHTTALFKSRPCVRNICRGFLNDFKETLYWFFLKKVHLVGSETLISKNAR